MGRPKKNISPEDIGLPTEAERRAQFIEWIARDAFLELVKHNGKVNNDYPSIVVAAATDLADRIGLGVKRKASKVKDTPAKGDELINLVDSPEDSE